MIRPYKTYAILIFVVYLGVVAVFHFELQKNLGQKYAAFREESERKLDNALQKIEVLNRRIQDLSDRQLNRATHHSLRYISTPGRATNFSRTVRNYGTRDSVQTWTGYDFARPKMDYCTDHVTNQFLPIGRMFIYSAYYDDRNISSTYVRMMALVPLRYRLHFYCEFRGASATLKSEVTYYEMCENHARPYGGFILSCPIPADITRPPCSVRLVTNVTNNSDTGSTHGNITELTVPILASNRLSKTTKHRLAICVPPIFGNIKQRLLIEFIEMNLLLNVEHLNFYTFQAGYDVSKILAYYEKLGIVTHIPWNLPVPKNKVWYHGQLLTINDCLYRHMYHFDYIGFHDIDELMVPHSNISTLINLLIDLDKKDTNGSVAGYVFPSAFFDIANRSRPGRSSQSYFTSELQRTAVFSQVRTKCLVKPSRIFELGIHHVSRPFKNDDVVVRLTEGQAFLHHYRKCLTEFDPRMKCAAKVGDDSLKRFESELKTRSRVVMETIFKQMATVIV